MSYAFAAVQRNPDAAGVPMEIDSGNQVPSADPPEANILWNGFYGQHRGQPPQRRPFMRQAGPDLPIEMVFDRNQLPELARLVMVSGEISFRRRDGSLLALEAAEQGNIAALRILLSRGDSVEHANAQGQTALLVATSNNNIDLFDALGPYLPNPNQQDHQGNTALMFACRHGNAPMVNQLLQMGADITLRNHANRCAADIARENLFPGILWKLRTFRMG